MKRQTIIALLLASTTVMAQNSMTDSTVQRCLEEAAAWADDGNERKAVEVLKDLHSSYPEDFGIAYELGYAYYCNADYNKCAALMRKLKSHRQAESIVWQLEGNALERGGRRGDAVRSYRDGLKRFPKSANIYMELGNIYLQEEMYEEALKQWRCGIDADPTFTANYYRAAQLLFKSSEPVEALFLSEAYRIMEPAGEASAEMGKAIVEMYASTISVDGNRIEIGMTLRAPRETADDVPELLSVCYEQGVKNSLRTMSFLARNKKLTLLVLADLKRDMLRWLESHEWDGSETVRRVLRFERAVDDAGHWTAYCMWLTRMGGPEEFAEWMSIHENDMERFAEWFGTNAKHFTLREE